MPRYIDADAIHYVEIGKGVEIALASDIDKIPTLSPDEVRGVGKWIEYHADYKCTACGETVKDEIFYMLDPYRLPTYCPNCGARLGNGGTDDS